MTGELSTAERGGGAHRIRVAFCLDSFAIGGTELNAVRTAEALDPGRIELSVIHLQTHGPLKPRYERLGVRMAHVPIHNLYSLRTVMQGLRLAKLLREWDVDVVHSHDIYCNIFAVPWARVGSGCAVIASRRWWYEAPRPALVTVNRWSYRFAHRILANSEGVAELLAGDERVPRRKIVTVPNFLGAAAFEVLDEPLRVAQRRAWGIPDGAFLVGIVARLSPVKNHALLLEALSQLDARFRLVVIGDGPARFELEDLARRLRIDSRVQFVGEMVSPRNLHQFLDVSVLVSLSEGFPNSIIEAMAAARPIVATPVGGIKDVITHGESGLLVPTDDPTALANALMALEGDPAFRARLGAAGRELAQTRYRQEFVIEKLIALYRSLELPRTASNRPV